MQKIASPQELQTELRRLLAYCQGEQPSREKLAGELLDLAERVARWPHGGGDAVTQLEEMYKREVAPHIFDLWAGYEQLDGKRADLHHHLPPDAEIALKTGIKKLFEAVHAAQDAAKAIEQAFDKYRKA